MKCSRLRRLALLACTLVLARGGFPPPVDAGHQLSGHWVREDSTLTVRVGNNRLGRKWGDVLARAAADWSRSPVLDVQVVPGQSDPFACRMTNGLVEICAQNYGETAWIGITRYRIRGDVEDGHMLAASIKVNDYHHRNPAHNPQLANDEARQATMCHELGHALGLAHQRGHSCLYPDTTRIAVHPNRHDFEAIRQIYRHVDAAPPVDAVRAAESGGLFPEPPLPQMEPVNGDVFVQSAGDSSQVVTVIDWVEPTQSHGTH